jgi:polar amino acid transport system permease protein
MEFDFSVVVLNYDVFLRGLLATLWLTTVALVAGVLIGLFGAAARLSGNAVLRQAARVYVTVFRSTPPLVLLFWTFYALPLLIGVRMSSFAAAALTLSVQSGAFFTEVFRAGIVSVERGQWEAGRALGMSRAKLMRRIVLPQAIRRMIPAFLDRLIELFKTTSLVAAIAYADLLFEAQVLSSRTFRPLEIFTVTALIYFCVLFAISRLVRSLELSMLKRQ